MLNLLAMWAGSTWGALYDPFTLMLGLLTGLFARRWWHLPLWVAVAAVLYRAHARTVNEFASEGPFFGRSIIGTATAILLLGLLVFTVKWLANRRPPPQGE